VIFEHNITYARICALLGDLCVADILLLQRRGAYNASVYRKHGLLLLFSGCRC